MAFPKSVELVAYLMLLNEDVDYSVADAGWNVVDDGDNADEVDGVHVHGGRVVVVAGSTAFLEQYERLSKQGHQEASQRA